MQHFLSGALTLCFITIGLFFIRFWSTTRDQLFLIFGVAFALLASERIILILTSIEDETRTYVYLIRLVAFSLIIYGIIQKNKTPR